MHTNLPVTDIVMLGTFSAWRLGTIQARALPFAQGLRARGLRCTIVTTPYDQPAEAGVHETVGDVPIINTVAASAGPIGTAAAVREQLNLVEMLGAKAVHVFKPRGFGGLAGQRTLGKLPVVVDADDWEGDGGWNDSGSYGLPQRRVFNWQERWLLQRADCVTAASILQAERAGAIRGTDDVTWVPNALAPAWHAQLSLAAELKQDPADGVTIVLYSRFAEFDADWLPRFLVALDAELAQAPDGTKLSVVVIGASQPFSIPVCGGGSAVGVTFLGYVARDIVAEQLGRAHIAIFPYSDSLISRSKNSVKLLELMASGCAIIASPVGDVPAVLGHAGVYEPNSDPAVFAVHAVRLACDVHRIRALGQAASARVLDTYPMSSSLDALCTAYASVGVHP